jgi:L-fuculose-phosphate aldolase
VTDQHTGLRAAGEEWSSRQKLALTCRILSDAGHDSGLSGQVTARAGAGEFVTLPWGRGFDEIAASNLLTVDHELRVVEGVGSPNPANRFHGWIYRARPDVNCIVHTHPLHTSALSMLEVPLTISHTDSCVLQGEVGFLPLWPGLPLGNTEGEIIAAALAGKKSLLLAHHGLIATADTIEEACVVALQFERAARLQLLAMAAGEIAPIDPVNASEARAALLRPGRIGATFSYYARRVLMKDRTCLQ